jgi:hypothetical protein
MLGTPVQRYCFMQVNQQMLNVLIQKALLRRFLKYPYEALCRLSHFCGIGLSLTMVARKV